MKRIFKICKNCDRKPTAEEIRHANRVIGCGGFHRYDEGCFHRYETVTNLDYLVLKYEQSISKA